MTDRTPAAATHELLASHAEYYRARAGEYDDTAYGDLEAARARIARVLTAMDPTGKVLELACGTGLWTEALDPRSVRQNCSNRLAGTCESQAHR